MASSATSNPQPRAPAPTPAPASTSAATPSSKKTAKGKKNADPADASKQIAARLAQLEQDAAGEKDQEAEIEREVKKANRDLTNLLSTISTPLARLELVQKRYQDLLHEMKKTEREHVKAKKRADQLQKDKDNNRSELSKVTSMKDKLEKLSRDVTRENKKLKEDLEKVRREETEAREELHSRLERMVIDVDEVIQSKEVPEVPATAEYEVDELFRQKFKSFIEQYELREIQFQSVFRTKELEIELYRAKLEKQRKAQEMESSKSHQLTRQVSTFSQTESELRTQLNIYVEKFKQVEETLNNSNDLFLTFRKEMEEMSKKTKRLEKENLNLTRKQEATNRNILEMVEERKEREEEVKKLRRKNERLEKLCRGMQAQGRGQAVTDMEEGEEEEGSDSEYEYEDEEDEEDVSGEYDEDTEEEAADMRPPSGPKTYGPVPPPSMTQQGGLPNGKGHGHGSKAQANGQVNGIKH